MTYIQNPSSIEEKSFQIIQSMITEKDPDYVFHSEMEESIIKRAIHTYYPAGLQYLSQWD